MILFCVQMWSKPETNSYAGFNPFQKLDAAPLFKSTLQASFGAFEVVGGTLSVGSVLLIVDVKWLI